MLPQPEPNAQAPDASKEALRSQRIWLVIWICGVISILLLTLMLLAPRTLRSHRKTAQTEAINNARQVGLALFEFDTEYGKFPNDSTIVALRTKSVSTLSLGTKTSNDYFRQLLASDLVQTEIVFYAKIKGARKPDNVSTGKKALEKGEVGFSYFAGLSSAGNPSRPLVITPWIPGTNRFDPTRFDGKAIVLKVDNSVTSVNINKDGHVMIGGRNILDPGHPVWAGEKWTLVGPE